MLSPTDLDLPKTFTGWRNHQLETALKAAHSSRYAFLIDGPTGCGKSLIAATVQRVKEEQVVYLCSTKQLQKQILQDFPYARTLEGRGNYKCLKFPGAFPTLSADHCTNSKRTPCHLIDGCPYLMAKRRALSADLAVLNYSYFLAEANHAGSFSGVKILVADECDTIEDQLMNFVELKITQKQLDRLGIEPPRFKTKFESWIPWAREVNISLNREIDELNHRIDSTDEWSPIDISILKRVKSLEHLASKLGFFIKEVDKDWVWYPQEAEWSFKPVWISKYAESTLWAHADKVLGMSATVLDPRQMSKNIGLRDYGYMALPSPFPKESRPVVYEPWASLTAKTMNEQLPRLGSGVRQVLDKHPNDKVLVHTVSYRVQQYLAGVVPKDRLLTHRTFDRAQKLKELKESDKPLVLLSPSMARGVDLPDEECRVIIIAKVPYPDLGDPQISKRVHASRDGNAWYAYKTVSTIVQMAGRATRSATDHSTVYILDEQFGRIYNDNRALFPAWFKEAVIM